MFLLTPFLTVINHWKISLTFQSDDARGAHTVWRTFLGGVPPFWWISGLGTQHPCAGCISSFLLSTWSCAQSVAGCRLAGYHSAPRHVLWPYPLSVLFVRNRTYTITFHNFKIIFNSFHCCWRRKWINLALFHSFSWWEVVIKIQNNHMHFTFANVLEVCQHEKTFHCRYLEYYVDAKLVIIPDSAL